MRGVVATTMTMTLRDLFATMTWEQRLAFIRARDGIRYSQDVWLPTFDDMHAAGKFSPEAARFTSRKLLRFADAVRAVADRIDPMGVNP